MENDNAPATRADLLNLENRLESRFKTLLEGRMDSQEERILGRVGTLIHESETRLLQAFYGFAEATNKRFNQIDGNVGIFLNRLGTLENRLLEVEKRLNLPPAA